MVANVVRNVIGVWGSYVASKKMHAQLLSHVLVLPMAFFDSQPLGRLLNRFTKDTEAVDVELLKLVSLHIFCDDSGLFQQRMVALPCFGTASSAMVTLIKSRCLELSMLHCVVELDSVFIKYCCRINRHFFAAASIDSLGSLSSFNMAIAAIA